MSNYKYGWVITRDHIADPTAKKGTNNNATGLIGHPERHLSDFAGVEGQVFKMYDGDGNLYYTGVIYGDFEGFEPLDEFGKPNAGCVEIRYKNTKSGVFEAI